MKSSAQRGVLVALPNGGWQLRLRMSDGSRPRLLIARGAPMTKARARETADALLERSDVVARHKATVDREKIATVRSVAEDWTSGRLAEQHPDHVKQKRSAADDKGWIRRFVLPEIGDVAIVELELEHAEKVMRALPTRLRPASRRQVAQVLHRLAKLAVFPLRLRPHNPIPAGWLPRVPKSSQKKQAQIYPNEADLFVASSAPIELRLFVGFISREGMRHDEAEKLTWADVDAERGIVWLDENKTDDARSWPLRPDVARALRRWAKVAPSAAPGDPVFVEADGRPLRIRAAVYREHLKAAGINRAELFDGSTTTKPSGFHALRALFVTEALARGMSEAWVTDRSGHRSSIQLRGYQRRARTFAEAKLAPLGDLEVLVFGPVQKPGPTTSGNGGSRAIRQGRKPGHRTDRDRSTQPRSNLKSAFFGSAGSSPAEATLTVREGGERAPSRWRRRNKRDGR